MNQDEGSSSARHDLGDEVMVVKPSCNYHFWCLWLEENKNFGGCIKFFLKNLRSKNFFLQKIESKILKNSIFAKFFLSNCTFQHQISIWNYFSFHLMYILSVLVKNYRFSKIFVLKAENFVPSDEVTLASNFGNIMNHRMVFKDFLEG